MVELLPSAAYRLKLENEDVVLAHAAGAATVNFVRLRPGDRVRVELSPHDRTRGQDCGVVDERLRSYESTEHQLKKCATSARSSTAKAWCA